jgi:tyrosine-protein kinase
MEWRDYGRALLRGWWLLVIFAIVGLAVGFFLPRGAARSMWTTTTVVGAPPTQVSPDASPLPPSVSTDQIEFFADTDAVVAGAGALAHLNQPIPALRPLITVTGPSGSGSNITSGQPGIVTVRVKAPTRSEAVALNIGLDEALTYEIAAASPGRASGFQVLQSTAPDEAVHSTTSVVSSRKVRAGIGLLIGIVVGALVALAAGLLDRRLNSARRAQGALGYPVVAEIASNSSEPYRLLWLSVFREPLAEPEEPGGVWIDRLEGEDAMLEPETGPLVGR